MNKEELIGKLQMVYVGDKNALNELIGYYDGLKQGIDELQQENQKYKEVIDKANKLIYYNIKYRNGADIYQFVDIESEILEPLKYILEQDEENGNAYLKEFNDWLKEVE